MGAIPKKQLALDTNVLIDLSLDCDFAWDFLQCFQEAKYAVYIPPTVGIELELLSESEDQPVLASAAKKSLGCLRAWRIFPKVLEGLDSGIADQFANYLISKNLLPDGEFNDGLILAETGLAEIPLLATSDQHILNIDEEKLKDAFKAKDISLVWAAHPKNLRKALR